MVASPEPVWRPGYEHLPTASFNLRQWCIHGIRHNCYSAGVHPLHAEESATTQWLTCSAPFSSVAGGYLAIAHFAPLQAHILLGFTFSDATPPIVFSPELRYRRNSHWGLRAILSTHEPIPSCVICGLEEDLLFLRTSVREGEEVFLYPFLLPKPTLQALFRSLLIQMNRMNRDAYPTPFHPFSHNCAMMALDPLRTIGIPIPSRHPAWWATTRIPTLLARYGIVARSKNPTDHHLNPVVRGVPPIHPQWGQWWRRRLPAFSPNEGQ